MPKKTMKYIAGTIFIILLGVASWVFYGIINQGVTDLLTKIGITNFYVQGIILISFVFLLLIFTGLSLKKSLNKIIKS